METWQVRVKLRRKPLYAKTTLHLKPFLKMTKCLNIDTVVPHPSPVASDTQRSRWVPPQTPPHCLTSNITKGLWQPWGWGSGLRTGSNHEVLEMCSHWMPPECCLVVTSRTSPILSLTFAVAMISTLSLWGASCRFSEHWVRSLQCWQ